ncbi:MAG: hypothetical protein JSU92_11860 [Deltaproteobacteria bacterium]|nr:MAG: hypothetical protein JSU92_11860 [Deltaproteobacteria bacterium]
MSNEHKSNSGRFNPFRSRGKEFDIKKIMTICLSIVMGLLLISGCGEEAINPVNDSIAVDTSLEATDAVSVLDYAELKAGGIEDIFPHGMASMNFLRSVPAQATPPPPPEAVLLHLNPNILKARITLLRAIRTPLDIMKIFKGTEHCSVEGICPDPKTQIPGNSCSISCDLTGAVINVPVFGSQVEIDLSGLISGTVESLSDTLFKATATATDLKLTGPDGRWLNYNGSVSWELTGQSDTGASWILSTSDLVIDDSSGARGTASGSRLVEIEFGKLFEAQHNAVLTYTPPYSEREIRLDVSINRTITIDGLTRTISIDDTVTTNGTVRTLLGELAVTREIMDANGKLEGIVVNGTITRSGPKGNLTITCDDVSFKTNCDHNPWGGTIDVTNGVETITISFRENCGCVVDVTRPDGSEIEVNTCEKKIIGQD